jgi:hypothetical protein
MVRLLRLGVALCVLPFVVACAGVRVRSVAPLPSRSISSRVAVPAVLSSSVAHPLESHALGIGYAPAVGQFILRLPAPANTNPIAASRLPSGSQTLPESIWSAAGATIASRSTVCTTSACNTMTSAGASATAAQINAAIASALANTVVKLTTGTYSLNAGLSFEGANSNITLRGDGPSNTKLNFTNNTNCGGISAAICVAPTTKNFTPSGEQNTGNWVGGYSKGTTTIQLDTKTNISVGTHLILDQANDSDTDQWPAVWVCVTGGGTDICSDEGGGGNAGRSGRGQHQIITVTSVEAGSCASSGDSKCDIGITPALVHPNWRTGQTPGAWWANSSYLSGIGIEDLKADTSGVTCGSPDSQRGVVTFYNATQSWMKNVETDTGCRAQVMLFQSDHLTVRDSYIHESHAYSSQAYGIEFYVSDYILVENNIVQHIPGSVEMNSSVGSVIAYNYLFDNFYDNNPQDGSNDVYMQAGNQQHTTGNNFNLIEGNDTTGLKADMVHGTSNWETWFRNYAHGWETGKSSSTYPVQIYKYNRFFSALGNVLGTSGTHTTYEGGGDNSIFNLDVDGCNPTACAATGHVAESLFRWGNWDVVSGTKWDSSEVPSGLTNYANAVPSAQSVPNSLYLSAKPSFFGSNTWPPIGPDVSSGTISGVGGHAYKLPAKLCYDNGTKDGNGFLTAFDGSTGGACY